MKKLLIYYDNPNEASDMYLKWLKKGCEKLNIEYEIVENYTDLYNMFESLDVKEALNYRVLPLIPVEDSRIITEFFGGFYDVLDIDNITGRAPYTDATAQGIYDHVVEMTPDRSTTIAVIGRGRIGKTLTDMLINYGYTVCVFNSKSDRILRMGILRECMVIVGLSSQDNIIDERDIDDTFGKKIYIDASHNFNFEDNHRKILRCGKWAREVLLSRLED